MLKRRTLFSTTAAVGSLVANTLMGRGAFAKTVSGEFEPRGSDGNSERLSEVNVESRDDYFIGVRKWRGDVSRKASRSRFIELLEENNFDPREDLDEETILGLVGNDPIIGMEARFRTDSQLLGYHNVKRHFEENADTFLAELEAYDKQGPGSLELNQGMEIPDYTRHEIHNQPGGYVGNPFAGYMYFYGTNARSVARRGIPREVYHEQLASNVVIPEDGRVNRILDQGCGMGQFTIGLKERFPDAEVWGVEVGAPILRFAHMYAVKQNIEIHYAHRLAEESKFPNNHFDIVSSTILHHEVTAEHTKRILAEAHRVLRPGGVYFPFDFYTGYPRRTRNAYSRFEEWKDHRWNHEIWRKEYSGVDFPAELRKVGFEVKEKGPKFGSHRNNVLATKKT